MTIKMQELDSTLLSPEETIQAFRCLEAGIYAAHLIECGSDDAELHDVVAAAQDAYTMLYSTRLKLVMGIAAELARRTRTDVDELFQEGCVALGEAIWHFDLQLGTSFNTLAYHYVRRAVRRKSLLRAETDLVRNSKGKYRKVRLYSLERFPPEQLPTTNECENLIPNQFAILDLMGLRGEVLRVRYGIGRRPVTRAVLAHSLNVSPSTVRKLELEALAQARGLLEADWSRAPEAA